jgi:hypothetical protein
VLAFKLCDFLTGHAALHARNSAAASGRDRCITFDAKYTGNARRSVAGSVDVALTFFFNALLYEIHRVSH